MKTKKGHFPVTLASGDHPKSKGDNKSFDFLNNLYQKSYEATGADQPHVVLQSDYLEVLALLRAPADPAKPWD